MHIELHPVSLPISPKARLSGGPRFKNTFLEDAGGDSQTQIYWDNPKFEWALQFIEQNSGIEAAIAFFMARKGGAFAWWFQDPFDHSTTFESGRVKMMADGKRYLFKRYPDAFRPYERRILCPIPGTVTFQGVSGTPTVNPYTGEVTGITALASNAAAQFEFQCPVVFATDFAALERLPNDVASSWAVSIREVGRFIVAS